MRDMGGKISFSCPICGRKEKYAPELLFEGALLKCSRCGLSLILQGCMWQEIKKEKERSGSSSPDAQSAPL